MQTNQWWNDPNADFNKLPHVTAEALEDMPRSAAAWFLNQPNIWRQLRYDSAVYYNCAHPDNRDLVARSFVEEAA